MPTSRALEDINPALAAIVETRQVRRISANLLDTYFGPQAGRRILAGQIRRAEGERLRAVIMMTDLRGFTALSDQLPGEEVIELLDDYFDALATPIEKRKGEVLKFIGDGMLAIFPAADDDDFSTSSVHALEAATEGLERLAAVNQARREPVAAASSEPASACISARSSTAMSVPPAGSTSR